MGAAPSRGPADIACSGNNVRSGGPGDVSRVQLVHPLLAPGYEIASVELSLRYTAGYTPPAGKAVPAPRLTLLLTDAMGTMLATLYTSQPLGSYSYDHFSGYSPPVHMGASGLHIANDKIVF